MYHLRKAVPLSRMDQIVHPQLSPQSGALVVQAVSDVYQGKVKSTLVVSAVVAGLAEMAGTSHATIFLIRISFASSSSTVGAASIPFKKATVRFFKDPIASSSAPSKAPRFTEVSLMATKVAMSFMCIDVAMCSFVLSSVFLRYDLFLVFSF